MTRSKNQFFLKVVEEFSGFPFAFPLRNITSSSGVIKCLSTLFAIFGTPGSTTRPGTTVRLIGIPKLLLPKWSCDLQNNDLPSSGQGPKRALQPTYVEGHSVPATLHKPPNVWGTVISSNAKV